MSLVWFVSFLLAIIIDVIRIDIDTRYKEQTEHVA